MRRKIIMVLLTLLMGMNFPALAQIPKAPVSFQSPNAATLGLFGDVPVSYFTGLPQIEIPIYVFKDNKTTIPISLNYHASGFRPDMHPGWTGLNWNLSALYAVSRSVNDMPDDYSNSNYGTLMATGGYYFNRNVLNTNNWNQISYMQSIARTDSSTKDTEPDEYSFSYPGGSGKFYFTHNGTWKVKSDKPVKVVFDNTFLNVPFATPFYTRRYYYGNTKSFSGFTIIDENGVNYVFGKDTTAIEYSMGLFSQWLDEWIAQTWYLTKIIQPGGQEVNITYQRDNFINQMYLSVNNNIETKVSSGGIFNLSPSCSSNSFYNISSSYGGRLISPVYLKWIIGSNCKVEFVRSNSTELGYSNSIYNFQLTQFRQQSNDAPFLPELDQTPYSELQGLSLLKFKKLDTIKIKYIDGTVERNYVFGYNNLSTERLTLESVTEVGKNGEVKPPYRLYYDKSVSLPPYLSNKNDHWGFYNGNAATIDEQNYYLYYYAKRNPDSTYLYAGTLNKIVYPLGGATEFLYEPHHYRKRLQERRSFGIDPSYNQNTLAGGLRIKKITSYNIAPDLIKKVKEYIYDSAALSSGILGGYIKYYFDDYRCRAFNDGNVVYSNALFSSQSVLPGCNNAQGSHVGYSFVREKLSDGSYTDYNFSNFDNGRIDESADTTLQLTRTSYEPYVSLETERGSLLSAKEYSATNTLLHKKEFTYIALNKSNEYIRALKCRWFNVCPGSSAVSGEEGTAYKIYTYSYLPASVSESLYDAGGSNPIVTTKSFTYDLNYRLLKTVTTTNSKAQTLIDSLKYAYDYPSVTVYQGMTTKNIVGAVVEAKKMNGSSPVNLTRTNFYNPYTGIYLPQTIDVQQGSAVAQTRFRYYAYDAKGNVLSASKEEDTRSSYIWDYDYNYPIAECINADTSSIAYTSFETTVKGNWTFSGSVTTDATSPTGTRAYALSGGSINKSGLNSSISYKVSYWSKNGAQTVSNSASTINGKTLGSWTYYEHTVNNPSGGIVTVSGTGTIDELRLFPAVARMTTYLYNPLIGIISQCDANNHIVYYEYDGFGRLHLVRDEYKNIIKRICYNYTGQTENCN